MVTEALQAEITPRHEPLERYYFHELLSYMGNHEGKMWLATMMAAQPYKSFNCEDLRHEAAKKQTGYEGWVPNSKTLSGYCKEDFAEIGIVEIKQGPRSNNGWRFADEFRIPESAAPIVLGFNGRGMKWSLRYPEHSQQKLLGLTSSGGGPFKTPQTRYETYLAICNGPSGGVDSEQIVQAVKNAGIDNRRRVFKTLIELKKRGILEKNDAGRYTIPAENYEAIFELCYELEAFVDDPYDPEPQRGAIAIVNNPQASAAIMKKAKAFSFHAAEL